MFKKFKSLFVVDDKPYSDNDGASKQKMETVSSKKQVENIARPKTSAQHQKQFDEVLLKALAMNNIEGYDYFEYRDSMASLSKMKMDEATRFQSAFALAKTMGASPQKLIESAEFYQSVLQKEYQKFDETLKFQKDKQVNSKNKDIEHYKQEIAAAEKQIVALNTKIKKLRKAQSNIGLEVDKAQSKILKTKESFELSYYQAMQKIERDISKMKQYLK